MSRKKLETRILTMEDVKSVLTMKETIQVVEKAFVDHVQLKTQMLPRRYLFLDRYDGKIAFMPAYIDRINACGIKIVSAYHKNPANYGLPAVLGTIILSDIKNGAPLAIMDGTYITMMRTGAIGAIAAKHLSRKGSKIAGIIGAGAQGKGQLRGLHEVRRIEKVLVFDAQFSARCKYAQEMSEELGIAVLPVESAEEVAGNVDILVTCTTSTAPVVMSEWVNPGLHITTMGVSVAGKQEIATEIFKRSKLVVDEIGQTSQIGGINVPFSKGVLRKEDIYSEIGEIILGKKKGRESDEEITVFVSSGLAIQDVATAKLAYEKAKERDIGKVMSFPF